VADELTIGSYLCTGHEVSSLSQTIVIFRNSTPGHGGTGLFRMASENAEKFKEGTVYSLFARKDPTVVVPARLLRKKQS
jgi:hypothetical protein